MRIKPPIMTSWITPQGGTGTVPGAPAYVAIINPTQWKKIKTLTGVDKAETYSSAAERFPGEVGKYENIRFIEATTGFALATAGAESPQNTVYWFSIMGQGAFARSFINGEALRQLIRTPNDHPESGDELAQTGSLGWKAYFVCKILDQDRLQRCEYGIA